MPGGGGGRTQDLIIVENNTCASCFKYFWEKYRMYDKYNTRSSLFFYLRKV
jgi:hypothetical protein